MAKRARGTTRPGQRRPVQKAAPRPSTSANPAPSAAAPGTEGLSSATSTPASSGLPSAPTAPVRGRTREASSAFTASAAQEYAYVSADLRRIVRVAAGLFGTMLVLFLLIDVFDIVKI